MGAIRSSSHLNHRETILLLSEIVRSGVMCGVDGGPQVRKFEKEFADCVGAAGAVGVSSGTGALYAALGALDVGPGDEVILPAYSFIADLLTILLRGARPVFADIDPASYGIDPAAVAGLVTDRTKAVLAVHLFGR